RPWPNQFSASTRESMSFVTVTGTSSSSVSNGARSTSDQFRNGAEDRLAAAQLVAGGGGAGGGHGKRGGGGQPAMIAHTGAQLTPPGRRPGGTSSEDMHEV